MDKDRPSGEEIAATPLANPCEVRRPPKITDSTPPRSVARRVDTTVLMAPWKPVRNRSGKRGPKKNAGGGVIREKVTVIATPTMSAVAHRSSAYAPRVPV